MQPCNLQKVIITMHKLKPLKRYTIFLQVEFYHEDQSLKHVLYPFGRPKLKLQLILHFGDNYKALPQRWRPKEGPT